MNSKEIADILYEFNARADITLEEIAELIEDKIPDIVQCKDCKWWKPRGKETPASIPFYGECQINGRKFETTCAEFCFWGEIKDV